MIYMKYNHGEHAANKLSLNVIKTKYMIVACQFKKKHLEHQFSIYVDQKPLTRDKTCKYLGVEIDKSLTWRYHVDTIAKKASGGIGVLRRIGHIIPYYNYIKYVVQIHCAIVFRLL